MEQNNLTRVPLEMFSAAEVEPRDIRWLWYPLGCFLQVQIPEMGVRTFFLDRLNPCNFCNRQANLFSQDSGSM